MKKIKCYIEIFGKGGDCPTIMMKRPLKREVESSKKFGYKVYKATLEYDNRKEL